jgi:phosphoadenosine phosphosulfate reductase
MLIESPRYAAADLETWDANERVDALNARRLVRSGKIERSLDVLEGFAREGRCYAGISWGKDSTVVADLCARLLDRGVSIPLVWVRSWWRNPDCDRVRDAFLKMRPGVTYDEVEVAWDEEREARAKSSRYIADGIAASKRRHGDRSITGVRADESKVRKIRMRHWGEVSPNTCAPIGWWSVADVFAYLHLRGLPVHPTYALTMGGLYERDHLRVDFLAETRGEERGRREWEERYYREEVRAIAAGRPVDEARRISR